MKIVEDYPPNYELIKLALGDQPKALFCYGDTIYNPSKRTVTPDLEAHEMIHQEQQGSDIDGWYARYVTDREFRLEQEIHAYGRQWLFAKEHVQDKKLLEWVKENMAFALSGESYGSLITYVEAESKIRNYKG